MSRPATRSVTVVPRARRQKTPQPTIEEMMSKPLDPTPYYGRTLSEAIGRIPTIGIDTGHIPGTRPDHIRHDMA